ncbi:MAG: KH domain-containing protein [Coprobacillus sp.]|nr:KH domain-containing protein [Coprobacillus sp.]
MAYLEDYLVKAIGEFNITATVKSHIEDEIIHVNIDSDHNSILIGKNGRTLQALNEIAKLAVSSKFKKKYRVLLDINDYKDGKYNKVVYMAKHMAREVQRSHETMTMEAMPADERRMIHNALSTMPHIRTESVGEGKHRQITIRYVE